MTFCASLFLFVVLFLSIILPQFLFVPQSIFLYLCFSLSLSPPPPSLSLSLSLTLSVSLSLFLPFSLYAWNGRLSTQTTAFFPCIPFFISLPVIELNDPCRVDGHRHHLSSCSALKGNYNLGKLFNGFLV